MAGKPKTGPDLAKPPISFQDQRSVLNVAPDDIAARAEQLAGSHRDQTVVRVAVVAGPVDPPRVAKRDAGHDALRVARDVHYRVHVIVDQRCPGGDRPAGEPDGHGIVAVPVVEDVVGQGGGVGVAVDRPVAGEGGAERPVDVTGQPPSIEA